MFLNYHIIETKIDEIIYAFLYYNTKVSKQKIKALFFRNLEKMAFVLKIVIKLYRYKYRLILILILKNFSFSIFLYFFITCKIRNTSK